MNPIFKQYKTVKQNLAQNKRDIEDLRTERSTILSQPKTPQFSHMTSTRAGGSDKMLNNQARVDQIAIDLNNLYIVEEDNKILLEDLGKQIEELISNNIGKEKTYAEVFYYRYILDSHLTLEDIASKIYRDTSYIKKIGAELSKI